MNIEQIATAALRLQGRFENPISPYVSGWNTKLLELEDQEPALLGQFTETLFGRLSEELTTPPDDDIAYLSDIVHFKKEGAVDVFSLNYDMCFEKSLAVLDEPFTNGFNAAGWNPECLDTMGEGDLRFLKLHGSLDWVDDDEYGICALQFPTSEWAMDLLGTTPLLIFGTDAKLTAKEPFLTLLYHFSKALSTCDVLVTIGFSFNDPYLNEVIVQRFNANTRMKVFAVGWKEDAHNTVRAVKAFDGSPRVEVCDQGAKKSLSSKTLVRKAKEHFKSVDTTDPFPAD